MIFRDITLYFHLVPDDFPIDEDGLIGSEMLSRYKAKINYEENFLEIASHVINLRYISNVNYLRPINKGSVNSAQAERCRETQGTMWRDDRNCANARNFTATTRTEKSSIVLGECSSLNVYSNLHVSHENVNPNNCLVLCTSVAQSKNSTEQTARKVDPEIKGQNNKNLNLTSEKLEYLKSDNKNKNCKPKSGESNNFKSKNSLLKSANGQNLKIELENSVFRNEALKNNVSQKNLNLLIKNLENKVSEDLPVNNCINLEGKVNKCMSINDKKKEKSEVAQKKIICLNNTCCNVKSLANKNKGKISFVCNKIRVFMCISYKHGNFK